jgi:hypothetical protein
MVALGFIAEFIVTARDREGSLPAFVVWVALTVAMGIPGYFLIWAILGAVGVV